jgi:hypothetical protein
MRPYEDLVAEEAARAAANGHQAPVARCSRCGEAFAEPEAIGAACEMHLGDPDAEGRVQVCGGAIVALGGEPV